jgi:hypothetical protein
MTAAIVGDELIALHPDGKMHLMGMAAADETGWQLTFRVPTRLSYTWLSGGSSKSALSYGDSARCLAVAADPDALPWGVTADVFPHCHPPCQSKNGDGAGLGAAGARRAKLTAQKDGTVEWDIFEV